MKRDYKLIIFKVVNPEGEPLLDFAIRKGEIWTARKSTKLKAGDKVRLIRKYGGKHEAEGIVNRSYWGVNTWYWRWEGSGFSSSKDWIKAYREINGLKHKENVDPWPYFIHITNITRLK